MASGSALPGPALNASRAALNSALNDTDIKPSSPSGQATSSQQKVQSQADTNGANGVVPQEEEPEEGEIQELDLAAHAEDIRTVFSDPMNFNVKVRSLLNCAQ
jgi:translation initiation factor 4E